MSGETMPLHLKLAAGIVSGSLGAILGLPPDVVLTRMAVDNSLPEMERRRYKNVFDGLSRIVNEEGVAALSTGLKVTVMRAIALNCSQLVTYTETKQMFLKHEIMKDETPLHAVCSLIATMVLTICVLPPEVAKTRLQKMKVINGVPEYAGVLDVWTKVVRKESIFSLWKGFTPCFVKTMPYNLILFIIYEDVLLRNYKRLVSKN